MAWKSIGGFKYKIVDLFKRNTAKQTMYGRGKKLSKPKIQNRNRYILKKKKKKKKLKIEYLKILEPFLK